MAVPSPRLHHATASGWVNDPLALTWHEGRYHLFSPVRAREHRLDAFLPLGARHQRRPALLGSGAGRAGAR